MAAKKTLTPSQQRDANKEREAEAAKKIQTWFRGLEHRRRAVEIINKHEQELALHQIDMKERAEFVVEVKSGRYENAVDRKNASILAISALRANQITYEEASVVLESAQNRSVYGKNNIQFFRFLNKENNFTPEAENFLKKLHQGLKEKKQTPFAGALPERYCDQDKGYQRFLDDFKVSLEKSDPSANLFYSIDQGSAKIKSLLNDFHGLVLFDLPPGHDPDNPDRFVCFSYGAADVMGRALYGKNWVAREYRAGELSIHDIRRGDERRVRAASIAVDPVRLPRETHSTLVTEAGVTRHDEYHRDAVSLLGRDINNALARIRSILRETTDYQWSEELWDLTDKDFSVSNREKLSKELQLAQALKFTFHVVDHKQVIQENAGKELEQIKKAGQDRETKGQLFQNKNATSIPMWIMVMDMSDRSTLWKNSLHVDVHSKEIPYDHHITLYESLNQYDDFSCLDVKQKLVILDIVFHSFDDVRKPYEIFDYSKAWGDFKEKFEIPAAESITFQKAKKGNPEQRKKNSIYLEYPPLVEKFTPWLSGLMR